MIRVEREQGALNTELWRRANRVRDYSGETLRPVEAGIAERLRERRPRRMLEVGCGAGRLTRALVRMGGAVEAFDISPRMVAACRRACPEADVREGDLRDLSGYPASTYDLVWAGFNVIDILGDAARGRCLDELRARLSPAGTLVFSSHNLASATHRQGPRELGEGRLLSRVRALTRMPIRIRNHRRTAPMEQREAGYAALTDIENDFAGLHYYIERDGQERQLARHQLLLEDCRDLDDRPVHRGERAPLTPELHYVCRPALLCKA